MATPGAAEPRSEQGRLLMLGALLVLGACVAQADQPGGPVIEAPVATNPAARSSAAGTTALGSESGAPSPLPAASPNAGGQELPLVEGILEPIGGGYEQPTSMIEVAEGRFLVAERAGTIRYVTEGEPILDLSAEIGGELGGERGLLGLALHPRYPADPRLFVSYTRRANPALVVVSFNLSVDGTAITEPGRTVIEVPHPGGVHYGGHVAFGPDGYLYLALGDGGVGNGDPLSDGQNPHTLLGTLVRLDVSNPGGYQVPPDNPFVDGGGAPEVWVYGLRNPWRFSFDRQTGDIWIGDVGEVDREELDFVPAGAAGLNFGWARYEGSKCFRSGDCDPFGVTMPVAEYDHADESRAVIGGYVYRGSGIPALQGQYVYGDLYTGEVWAIATENPGAPPRLAFRCDCMSASFAEDMAGNLYVLGFDNGVIYQLTGASDDDG